MNTRTTNSQVRRGEVVHLDVPVVLQASVSSCALAAVSGIIRYLTGRIVRQRELSELLGQRWTCDGTTMGDACNLVRRLTEATVEQRATASFEQVTVAIDQRRPMLAALHVGQDRGHMVAVVGVVRGTASAVIVNDSNFRWPLLVPWPEFAASLSAIAFVGVAPGLTPRHAYITLPPACCIEPISVAG